MLGDFEDKTMLSALNLECVQDGWEISIEVDVHDGTDNL
jgi:hypothetical protein